MSYKLVRIEDHKPGAERVVLEVPEWHPDFAEAVERFGAWANMWMEGYVTEVEDDHDPVQPDGEPKRPEGFVSSAVVETFHGNHNQKSHGNRRGGRLAQDLNRSGGFTYQPITNTAPKTGYAVSPFPEREYRISASEFNASAKDRINAYEKENRSFIAEDPARHLGGWKDEDSGDVFLDVIVVLDDQGAAEQVGRDTNQLAIYDLGAGQEIRLDG